MTTLSDTYSSRTITTFSDTAVNEQVDLLAKHLSEGSIEHTTIRNYITTIRAFSTLRDILYNPDFVTEVEDWFQILEAEVTRRADEFDY
jgi:hypothetical protein